MTAVGAITAVAPAPDGRGWIAIQRTSVGFRHHRFTGPTAEADARSFGGEPTAAPTAPAHLATVANLFGAIR